MSSAPRPAAGRLDLFLLAAMAAWSVLSLVYIRAVTPEAATLTGADGVVAIDQLQYLAWIREAAGSVLVSNRFDLGGSDAVFLHPVFAASGMLHAAGVDPRMSLLVWKPVAVGALFLGFRAYVRRFAGQLRGRAAQLAALTLALFFYYPIHSILERLSLGTAGERFRAGILTLELFPAGLLWGYLPSAIAVGLMPVFLLALERAIDPSRRAPGRGRAWYTGWAAAAGLMASWLHPWRGMIILGIVAVVVLWDRDRRRYIAAALPLLATSAPLVYYGALSRLDPAWEHATVQNAILKPPLWALLLALAPLAAIAALGTRGRARGFQEKALVAWLLVSLAAYFVAPSFPSHVFAGASLPIAILAVRAAQRLHPPRVPVAAGVVIVVVLGMIAYLNLLDDAIEGRTAPHSIARGERDALRHLARLDAPGGVLPTPYLGMAVPGLGDRDSWLGNYLWTPNYEKRRRQAEALFAGRLGPARARAVVRRSGARFVLADCRSRADLVRLLGPDVASARRFGCAMLVELRAHRGQALSRTRRYRST